MVVTSLFLLQSTMLVALLAMSAFFSGSETAYFSLSDVEADQLQRRVRGSGVRLVETLNRAPDEILATILTGNMFVNIFATAIAEAMGARIFASQSELFSIGIMTILLLLVGEMTPKSVAIRHSLAFSRASARPLQWVYTALNPLVRMLAAVRTAVLSLYPERPDDAGASHHVSVLSAIRGGFESGTLPESELKLLESFFDFRNRSAQDVMIPRTALPIVDITAPVEQVVAQAAHHRGAHPIWLVSRGDVDHVTGFVHRRDLVAHSVQPAGKTLNAIQRPVHFVHATKLLPELVREMREEGTEVVVVIDEFGGTAGAVTYHTVVERLFEDFYPDEPHPVAPDGTVTIPGSFEVEELAELFDVTLPDDNRTVGGMVVSAFDAIPLPGQSVRIGTLEFTVDAVGKNKVDRVSVRSLST